MEITLIPKREYYNEMTMALVSIRKLGEKDYPFIAATKQSEGDYHTKLPGELLENLYYWPKWGYFISTVTKDGYPLPVPVKTILREGYHITEDGRIIAHVYYSERGELLVDQSDIEYIDYG